MKRLEDDSEIKLARKYFEKARNSLIKSKDYHKFCAVMQKDDQFLMHSFGSLHKGHQFNPVETLLLEATDKLSSVSIKDSTIYLTMFNGDDSIFPMGKYFSEKGGRIALYKGVKDFVLFHEDGFYSYPTEEYYENSLKFKEDL
jgi:hypothetical protein